ncbi:UNVERIFIED_CONTAM: hypothetical protein K2H54_031239 [Gekko kuhli]
MAGSGYGMPMGPLTQWDHFNPGSTTETYILTEGPRRESQWDPPADSGYQASGCSTDPGGALTPHPPCHGDFFNHHWVCQVRWTQTCQEVKTHSCFVNGVKTSSTSVAGNERIARFFADKTSLIHFDLVAKLRGDQGPEVSEVPVSPFVYDNCRLILPMDADPIDADPMAPWQYEDHNLCSAPMPILAFKILPGKGSGAISEACHFRPD